MRKRIWIVGSSGRLGSALKILLTQQYSQYEVVTTDIGDVDILNQKEIEIFMDQTRPEIVVNCAAVADLEWCEEYPDEAFALHGIGARNLAIATSIAGAEIYNLSTENVYDGDRDEPYSEFDIPNPRTVYGLSKMAGERFVRTHNQEHTIFRASWMYGKKKLNQILRDIEEKGYTEVYDTITSPTPSLVVAERIISFFDLQEYGTIHLSCEGHCSLKEFTEKFLELMNVKGEVRLKTSDDSKIALRPRYSSLDNMMLRITLQDSMPHWESALERFVRERM